MKVSIATSILSLALATLSHAVSINLATTAGGSRFFVTAGVPLANTGTVEVGFMSDATNGSTFKTFGSAAIHGNTVFTSGMANAALNSSDAQLPTAAGQPIYIRVFDSGSSHGGIWKTTTVVYPVDLSAGSVNAANASLSTDAWTVVTPTSNWAYTLPSATYLNPAPLGLSDAQAIPTARTGAAFTLGAAIVPEPSVTALLGLLGLVGLRRKR